MKRLLWTLPLVLVPSLLQAQELLQGTLFTNDEQRNYLDYLRQDFLAKNQQNGFDIEESQIPDIPVDGPAGPSGPTEYTLGGIMRRSDGSLSIWLNNQLVSEQQLPANARLIRDGATLALQFSTTSGTRLLRPGQTLAIESGAVQERYQRPPPLPPAPVAPAAESTPASTTAPGPAAAEAGTDANAGNAEAAGVTAATAASPVVAGDAVNAGTAVAAATADATAGNDPDAAINNLPPALRNDPDSLESMIQTLQTLRDQVTVKDDE